MPAPKKSVKPARRAAKPTASEFSPNVFVGGWKDAVKFEGARFCVLDEAPEDMPAGTHIQIYDESSGRANTSHLDELAKEMRTAHARGEPVLVYCGHGIRRSPLGAAWYLHRVEGLGLDEAYDRVRSVRPRIEHAREWVDNANELR